MTDINRDIIETVWQDMSELHSIGLATDEELQEVLAILKRATNRQATKEARSIVKNGSRFASADALIADINANSK